MMARIAEGQETYRNSRPIAARTASGRSTCVYTAVPRLAQHHGVTNREVLERLIAAADNKMTANSTLPASRLVLQPEPKAWLVVKAAAREARFTRMQPAVRYIA
jgi:hypothetical protein